MKIGVNPESFLYCSVKQVDFKILGPEKYLFHIEKSRMKSQLNKGDFNTRLQNSYEMECKDCLHVIVIYVVTEIPLLQKEVVYTLISLGKGAFMNPLCC